MLAIVARQLFLHRRQLRTVFEHLADQRPLRFNRLSLLNYQRRQNPVRDNEQNHEQRQNGCGPRLGFRSCILSAVNDGQNCPQARP